MRKDANSGLPPPHACGQTLITCFLPETARPRGVYALARETPSNEGGSACSLGSVNTLSSQLLLSGYIVIISLYIQMIDGYLEMVRSPLSWKRKYLPSEISVTTLIYSH